MIEGETCLETFLHVLGDYSGIMPISALMDRASENMKDNSFARVTGLRFVKASEPKEGQRFDEETVKCMTGQQTITARKLFKDRFEYYPQFKSFIDANKLPGADAVDNAMWGRIELWPFLVTFLRKPENWTESTPLPPRHGWKNLQLQDELKREETDGILAWAVRGCLAWQQEGLNSPSIVKHAVESYRTDNDEVSAFLDRYCIQGPDLEIAVGELYDVYRETCRVNRQYQTLSKIKFGKRIDQLKFDKYEKGKPKTWTWRGVAKRPFNLTTDVPD